jgi:hypothetical protein
VSNEKRSSFHKQKKKKNAKREIERERVDQSTENIPENDVVEYDFQVYNK